MSNITGEVIATDDVKNPYTVIFKSGRQIVAEHPVTSLQAAEALIDRLLPTLQGFEPKC